ncbi:MAG TPA: hypothetical protein EYH08_07475 [Pyrodictium sp.]|nr:hypothetical protein [Pyrodictium sp.]
MAGEKGEKRKVKRVIRLFFNTYDENVAKKIFESLKVFGEVKVRRSSILKEFYYVEITPPADADLKDLASKVEEVVRSVGDDSVFGIRVYYVQT